jgi:DNA/RNA-binding protein KIN17
MVIKVLNSDWLLQADAKMKEKRNRKDYWLTEGIVVKLTSKSVGEKYYKKKGIIKVTTQH